MLSSSQWDKVSKHITGKPGDGGIVSKDNRAFVEGVLWIGHTGTPWRKIDPSFGDYHVIYTRFLRWHKKGIWVKILDSIKDDKKLHALISKGIALRGPILNYHKNNI